MDLNAFGVRQRCKYRDVGWFFADKLQICLHRAIVWLYLKGYT